MDHWDIKGASWPHHIKAITHKLVWMCISTSLCNYILCCRRHRLFGSMSAGPMRSCTGTRALLPPSNMTSFPLPHISATINITTSANGYCPLPFTCPSASLRNLHTEPSHAVTIQWVHKAHIICQALRQSNILSSLQTPITWFNWVKIVI